MGETTHLPADAPTPASDPPPPLPESPATVVQMAPQATASDAPEVSSPPANAAPAPPPGDTGAPPPPYPYYHPPFPPYPGAPQPPPYYPHPAGAAPGTPPPYYPPHPAYMGYYYPPYPPAFAPAGPPPPMGQPFVVPSGPPPRSPAEVAAAAANQQMLLVGIMAVISLVHLPWLAYLVAIHGCWGSFLDLCYAAPAGMDDMAEGTTGPFAFAQVAFFILRVQTVLSVDFQQFSQVMQIGTGLGSFALTKIVAANGTVVQGRLQRYGLAVTCALAFVLLLWVEVTLSSSVSYPVLGDETVLSYIDSELPEDFVGASQAKAGLMQYLQFLRLADALIFGAALAMPKSPRQDAK